MNNNKDYVGESDAFLNFRSQIYKAGPINRPVLIIGERGTGKERAAHDLHYSSDRWTGKPYITVNCVALPPSLIESELFGYTKGSFTGAYKDKMGRFEEADGGTLFLDEIGNIPVNIQEKILRVVEYGEFQRIGDTKTKKSDVRIVGATNADLPKLCREGLFMRDLLDRLSFEIIYSPPLREREEDIILLANNFTKLMARECGKKIPVISEQVKQQLLSYWWPGNVRELKNTIERAVYKTEGPVIEEIQLDPFKNPFAEEKKTSDSSLSDIPLTDLDKTKENIEKVFVERAIKKAGGNQKKAASYMNISYDKFRGLYRKYFTI